MSGPLRQLLAEFVVQVDKAGELARGNAAVDALKERLGSLVEEFDKVKVPAARAGKAVQQAFAGGFGSPELASALRAHSEKATASLFGSFGAATGGVSAAGPQLGPTRDTLNAQRAQMRAAEEAAAKYALTLRGKLAGAVNAVRAGFNGGGGSGGGPGLLSTLGTVRNGLIALGVGATARAVVHLVDGIGDIRESAQKLGVSTGVFQRLKVLADQNGTSVESLGTAFRTLANSAVQPTKESTKSFAKLGVSVKDANGQFKGTNDLFFEVAAALADVGNETERSAIAQDLLGRSAQELKPLFAGGRAEIEKQRKALAEMNVLSEETINQADDLSDSWKAVGPSILVAAEPLIKLLLPALADFTAFAMKVIDVTGKWIKQTDFASIAMVALGVAVTTKVIPGLQLMVGLGGGATKTLLGMAGAGAKAAWSFLRMALPLLAVEDFITFLRGGDTETGRLLDAVFGKGSAEGTLATLKDLGLALKDVWGWLLGNGMGDSARTLYRDLSDFISLITNNLLKLIGIGEGGINGPFKLGGDSHKLGTAVGVAGQLATGNLFGALQTGAGFLSGTAGAADTTMAAPVQYGPPPPPSASPPITVGDRIVNVTMGPSATAGDVGRAVGGELDRDMNALIAVYGGF